jgi:hypothetical protein
MIAQTLRVAALAIGAVVLVAGCSWDATSNLPSASDSALPSTARQSGPQTPESMKTGTVTGETNEGVFHGSL